MAVSEM